MPLSEIDLLLALIENEAEWLEGIRYSTVKELGYAMISTAPLDIVADTTMGNNYMFVKKLFTIPKV